jgi:hypothetical protein
MAMPFHTNTTGVTVPTVQVVNNVGNTDFWGVSATNQGAVPYYIKFAWQGNSNVAPAPTSTGNTVVPDMVFEVPTIGLDFAMGHESVTKTGQLYFWYASTPGDATNASVTTSGDAITVFYG